MYTPLVRILFIILFIIFRLINNENSIFSFIGILLIIFGYFRYGTVYLAFMQTTKSNFIKAEKLMKYIRFPNFLTKKQKAYFHLVNAYIFNNKGFLIESKNEFNLALNLGLRTENITSLTKLNIAKIELALDNADVVEIILNELDIKKLKPKNKNYF